MHEYFPVHHRSDSRDVLLSIGNKPKSIIDVFNEVTKKLISTDLSYSEMNDVLYYANDYLYKRSMELKNPLSSKTKD